MYRIESIIDEILDAEGGLVFTNRPNDRGGPTFAGITFETFTAWRLARYGTAPNIEDLKNMQESEVREIYRERYVIGPNFDDIEDHLLRHNVIDAGVLHGQGWAARRIQEVAAVKADGIIGPISLKAINRRALSPAMNLLFVRRRVEKIVRIVKADTTQLANLAGWSNRALRFLLNEAELLDAL